MRTLPVCLFAVVVLAAGCSSAGLPGADDTLDQIDKAEQFVLESDLRQVAVAEEVYFAQNDTYTTDQSLLNLSVSEGVVITIARADATTFCAEATDGDATLHLSKDDPNPTEGPC